MATTAREGDSISAEPPVAKPSRFRGDSPLKVYLIRCRNRRDPVFYSEDAAPLGNTTGHRPRGVLERWTRGVRSAVLRARRRAGPRTTRALGWLMRRPNPDEALLHALRGANSIELIHPEQMSADRARRLWFNYLKHRQRQQLGAAAWDLLLVAVTAPMLIMPGPGVLAFWFLYRALVHLLAMFGAFRARSRHLPLACQGSAVLDLAVAPGDDVELAHIGAQCDVKGLATYLRHLEKWSANPAKRNPHTVAQGQPSR